MSIVEVKDLTVKYREITALSNISFGVEPSDFIGVVGPNGSGKTTLVKALLGLLPYEGSILFKGKDFFSFTKTGHVGYLPQKMSYLDQHFPATALEIVVSGVYCCKKFPKYLLKSDYKSALKAMDTLGVINLRNRPVGMLSGGQQQRILLARSLVHNPEILILDEPTIALDPQSRDVFYETVEKLNKERKVTVILVTHDVVSIQKYVSKILYLDNRLIFYGSFDDFCSSAKMSDYFKAGQPIICHRH